jgi:hypothetical protein
MNAVPDSRLFLIKLELEKGFTREFIQWFSGVHAQALLRAGFRTVNSFLCHGSDNQIFNIHEILGDEIFKTENYQHEISSDTVFANQIKQNIRSRSNSVYRQNEMYKGGLPQHPLSTLDSSLASPVVSLSATNLDELKMFRRVFSNVDLSSSGMNRARFCVMEGQHPSGRSTESENLVVIEWFNLTSALQFFENFEPRVDLAIGQLLCRSISTSFFVN